MLTQLSDTDETPIPLGIATVLDQYADVFENPTELPPDRLCNHKITLMPGAKPVNLRPYRYSYFQKVEMEKIIDELLKASIIQPSTSPYASPVLLVKKKARSVELKKN